MAGFDALIFRDEAAAHGAMLGIGPPMLLHSKPVDFLTDGERELFARRLARYPWWQ